MELGFNGSHTGTNPKPAVFTLERQAPAPPHEPRGGRRVTRTRRPPRTGPTCRTDPAAGRAFLPWHATRSVRNVTHPRTGGISTSTYDRSRARTRRDCRRRPRRGRDHERHPRRAAHHPRAHLDASRSTSAAPSWRRRARTRGTTRAPATRPSASSTTRPQRTDGSIDIAKAVTINEQFQLSRELWHHLAHARPAPGRRRLPSTTPHMTFVRGADNADFLRRRYETLREHPLFSRPGVQHRPGADRAVGPAARRRTATPTSRSPRRAPPPAPTSTSARLTRAMIADAVDRGARLHLESEITQAAPEERTAPGRCTCHDRRWNGHVRSRRSARSSCSSAPAAAPSRCCRAPASRRPRASAASRSAGSSSRRRTRRSSPSTRPRSTARPTSALPPMSVPHLDTRVVDGGTALLFGPYAGLEHEVPQARLVDRPDPLDPAGQPRPDARRRRAEPRPGQVPRRRGHRAPDTDRCARCGAFMPTAHPRDWELDHRRPARPGDQEGQGARAACWSSAPSWSPRPDGTIAGLLGASPGASTAVATMLDLLERCFPERVDGWQPQLRAMMPSLGGGEWDESFELDQLVDDEQRRVRALSRQLAPVRRSMRP